MAGDKSVSASARAGAARIVGARGAVSLTLLALASGLAAIHFALDGRFAAAVTAVMLAGVLDAVDGSFARWSGQASAFGARLDSLADAVNFGAAPLVILHAWHMADLGAVGWLTGVAYAGAVIARLARFDTATAASGVRAHGYFDGVPAPLGAVLVLLPLIATLELGPGAEPASGLLVIWPALIGIALVAPVPTFARSALVRPIAGPLALWAPLAVGVLAGLAVAGPWVTVLGLSAAYVASLPISTYFYWHARLADADQR